MCGEYTDYTRSHHHPGAQFLVGSSRNWSVFLERPNMGRHEKAPVRCPFSRVAALHGAPRTLSVSFDGTNIHTSICTKPIDRHGYLHYNSLSPIHIKKSIVYSQFIRYKRICSTNSHLNIKLLIYSSIF